MITSNILKGAVILIALLAILILIILIYLIFKRIVQQRFQQKVSSYIQQHEKEWFGYLVEGKPMGKMNMTALSKAALDKIFVTYMTTINDEEVRERIGKFASLSMKNYYKKQLKSNDESIRLNVLQRALLLDLVFMVPEIERRLKQNRYNHLEEYMLMIRIMSKYNPNLFMAHMFVPRIKFNEYEYKIILAQIDESYIQQFKKRFEELPIHLRLSLLDYLSFHQNLELEYLSFYESLLDSIYKEIRIRALKAIATFGGITDYKYYEPFIESPEWEERLVVAKILRFTNVEQAYDSLKLLMKDSNWNVSRQAALSLKSMRYGKFIIQQMIEENEQQYVVDIAREVLGTVEKDE